MIGEQRSTEQLVHEIERLRQRISQLEEAAQPVRSADGEASSNGDETIRQQERFLANVLESLAHPFYVIDANDYSVITANSASGLDLWRKAGKCYALIYGQSEPCEDAKNLCVVREVKETRGPVTVEHVYYTKERHAKYLEVHGHPIFDDQRNVIQVIEYCLDITERKRAEYALRTTLSRLDGLISAVPDAIFFRDLESRFLVANEAFEKMVGVEKECIIGSICCDFLSPDKAEYVQEGDETVLQLGQTARGEQFMVCEGGEATWYDTIKFPVTDQGGHVTGIGAICRDITEQKTIEEDLRASLSRNRLLIDESPIGIGIVQDERMVYANPALSDILGVKSQVDLMGLSIEELVAPEDRALFQQRRADRQAGKPVPPYCELRGLTGNGERVDLMVWPRPGIGAFLGKPAELVFAADITEFKAMRAHLLSTQKTEALGTLVAGISHEFNNLLTVASGYTDIILANKRTEDQEFSDLQKIAESCSRGAELVRKLRLFSRKADHEFQALDLNRAVFDTVAFSSRTLPPNTAVNLDLEDSLHGITADLSLVTQATANLILNAGDAMPAGGTLSVETRNCTLDEDFLRTHPGAKTGDYVRLTVSDTGHGMDDATISRIFDPFFTTRGLANKSGLGLAVVRGIVEEHGGFVECESKPDQGTTFSVYFPATPKQGPVEQVVEINVAQGGGETILLVEDEDPVRQVLSRILSNAGYRVIEASNGKEALALYEKERGSISLVTLDLVMPQMDGRQCLEGLLKVDPRVRVVVTTGYSESVSRAELLAAGAWGFVSKPFERAHLLKIVREVIDVDLGGVG